MHQLLKGTPLQGGKYRIEETVAQSDVSITYLATWVAYNLKVCIKEFFMKGLCDRAGNTTIVTHALEGTVAPYIREFLREVRTVASLDHPSIIRVHDRFEENNTAYYVMDFVEGPTLADVISKHSRLEEKKAREYVEKIADALHYMHEQGITHLGVEASNIMVRSRDNMPILIDFCLSKHSSGARSFSPQQDIHALAALFYQMLTGKPLPAPDEVTPETFAELTDVTPAVVDAIEKASHPGLASMPASIPDFLSALKGTVAGAFQVDLSVVGEEDDEEETPTAPLQLSPSEGESEVQKATEVSVPEASKPTLAETQKLSTAEERAASAKRAADMDREAALARSASVERAAQGTTAKGGSAAKKAQPVWETKKEAVKTAEELQKEKYSAVSQQFAKNMARNQSSNGGSAGLFVLLAVVIVIALVAFFLL